MPPEPPQKNDEALAKPGPGGRPPASRHEPVDLTRGALPKIFEKQVTPFRLYLTSIVAVFISQFFVCLALRLTGIRSIPSPYAEALLTGISLVVLIMPVLYAGLYRPMIKHIARQLQLENALRELATVDELTDILNRRGFRAVAEDYLRLARRLREGLCCLFMDLNGFKRINDTLGHNVGDQALIETAQSAQADLPRVRPRSPASAATSSSSSPSRSAPKSADRMVARLQEKLAAVNAQPGRKYQISVCVGVARFEPGQECSIARPRRARRPPDVRTETGAPRRSRRSRA